MQPNKPEDSVVFFFPLVTCLIYDTHKSNTSVAGSFVQPSAFKRPPAKVFLLVSEPDSLPVFEIYGSALRCSVFCLHKTVYGSNSEQPACRTRKEGKAFQIHWDSKCVC